jgi:indole-3-glycerol phosphate synthase
MTTEILRVNRDIIMALKRQHIKDRQEKIPFTSVLALAQMQSSPAPLLNLIADETHPILVLGQITRPAQMYDPITASVEMVEAGADGLMFFTDHTIHLNDLEDLFIITRELKDIPIVYQNYILNEYHVVAVRSMGASGLVLYPSLMDNKLLMNTVTASQRWRFTVMIQVQSPSDLEFINKISPHVVCYGDNLSSDVKRYYKELKEYRAAIPSYTKFMLSQSLDTIEEVELALELNPHALIVSHELLKSENGKHVMRLIKG